AARLLGFALSSIRLTPSEPSDRQLLRLMPSLVGELRFAASVCAGDLPFLLHASKPSVQGVRSLQLLTSTLSIIWLLVAALRKCRSPLQLNKGLLHDLLILRGLFSLPGCGPAYRCSLESSLCGIIACLSLPQRSNPPPLPDHQAAEEQDGFDRARLLVRRDTVIAATTIQAIRRGTLERELLTIAKQSSEEEGGSYHSSASEVSATACSEASLAPEEEGGDREEEGSTTGEQSEERKLR
ncbi:MAG: hypothetical protein SGPRY_012899, partial [Prymnesium sp.]